MEQAPKATPMLGSEDLLPRETLLAFLTNGVKMMQSDETRALLKDVSAVPAPGKKLIEIQRREWDPLGVDRDVGCAQLDRIDASFPGDQELRQARDLFVLTAQRMFLRAMEDRKPKRLETKKPIPRDVIIDFLDCCNTRMDLPETHELLRRHLENTKQVPNQLIIDIQRDLLEVVGWQRDHGCNMLSRIVHDFPDDQELHHRLEYWRRKATATCMQVVRLHQLSGGELPGGPFGDNPEMQRLQGKAKEEIEAMTPLERGTLLQKMQKKVEVFMNLPPDGQQTYMKRLGDDDKLEFVKTQLLLVSLMRQQWEAEQSRQQANAQGAPPELEVKPPSQQMMM